VCGEHELPRLFGRVAHRFIPTCVGNIYFLLRPKRKIIGSSPRVWGTYNEALRAENTERFIPTCVGNMTQTRCECRLPSVHPHVCGEHIVWIVRWTSRAGSSPRVWGTFADAHPFGRDHRFIPTCVGNMARLRSEAGRSAVHPHVCGEHSFTNSFALIIFGSSPRVWGTCTRRYFMNEGWRFIPTCVGNMMTSAVPGHSPAVHPHVCGEHVCPG